MTATKVQPKKKNQRKCKDCIKEGFIETTRAAMYPGPRCYTHWLAEKKRVKLAQSVRWVSKNYEITADEYDEIYEFQKGICPICLQAKGHAKRLAVDHDHRRPGCEHDPSKGCRNCIRGLLCSRCNNLIAWFGLERLRRAIKYIEDPPAQHVLNPRNTSPDVEVH